MKKSRNEGLLGAAILIGIVLFAVLVMFMPSSNPLDEGSGSVSSSKPAGRRALFLALNELGFDAHAFRDAPNALPHDQSVLWLPRAPSKLTPTRAEIGSSEHGPPERMGLHSIDHYRRFVEGGGTLVLAASDETTRFLVDELGLDDAASVLIDTSTEESARIVHNSHGDELAIPEGSALAFEPLDQNGVARELWTVEYENTQRPFAVVIPDAAGSVVVLATDAFVDNRSIGSHDNALAAVHLVEDLHKGGSLLFSEYELGEWTPPSLLGLLVTPKLVLVTLHSALLLALFVWMHAFARAFPRDPEALALYSPHLRARSLAGVFTRARRFATLALLLRRGSLDRLHKLARVRPATLSPEQNGAALRKVTAADVTEFARQGGFTAIEPKLLELFVTRSVRRRENLDALDRDLRALEPEIERHLKSRDASVGSGS